MPKACCCPIFATTLTAMLVMLSQNVHVPPPTIAMAKCSQTPERSSARRRQLLLLHSQMATAPPIFLLANAPSAPDGAGTTATTVGEESGLLARWSGPRSNRCYQPYFQHARSHKKAKHKDRSGRGTKGILPGEVLRGIRRARAKSMGSRQSRAKRVAMVKLNEGKWRRGPLGEKRSARYQKSSGKGRNNFWPNPP